MPVLPEVEKLRGKKILCLRGEEENESLCRRLDRHLANTVVLSGGHHFGGNYDAISHTILNELSPAAK